ncbi:hypothetical protein SH139x_001210 [Planctomycetaceae bacterium SH139]
MKFLRRYWVAGLVLMMVGLHAVIIGYVRSQVARLKNAQSTAITVGSFRFQPIRDPDQVYCFRLHAVLDPTRRNRGEERLEQLRLEIAESAEQLLRQVEPDWLLDPSHDEIKARLLEVVLGHINEPLVQRVLITEWLAAPASAIAVNVNDGSSEREKQPPVMLQ